MIIESFCSVLSIVIGYIERRSMGLYRILLADDEEEIREAIINRVNWEELGFEFAAFAENGMEALEMMEKEMPDVIMTDIRMPFLNGLEFVEKVIEIRPTIKIIVFSGFDEFEYAQKAISLNVEAYLLKPMSAIKIKETMTNLKNKMDGERDERSNIELLKKNYLESLPIMKEQFLISWVEGKIGEEDIPLKAAQYGIRLSGSGRTAVVLKLNDLLKREEQEVSLADTSRELLLLELKRTVDTLLRRFHEIHSFIYMDYVVVIAEFEEESKTGMLMNEVNEVCKTGWEFTGRVVTAGIGGIYRALGAVKNSFREAYSALGYSTLLCKEGAYTTYIGDMEPAHKINVIPSSGYEEQLLSAMKTGNNEMIQHIIGQFFEELKVSGMSLGHYQIYILRLLTSILEIASTYQIDSKTIFYGEMRDVSEVLKMHSLFVIKDWMLTICLKISEGIHQEQMDSRKYIVSKAKDLVEQHYADVTLSAEKICSELHVSTAYFSTIFKKEEKVNFITFLTDVRLKHAVKMLRTTEDKTYIVAGKAGYSEPNYFSFVFKKKFGMSPSRYRSSVIEST